MQLADPLLGPPSLQANRGVGRSRLPVQPIVRRDPIAQALGEARHELPQTLPYPLSFLLDQAVEHLVRENDQRENGPRFPPGPRPGHVQNLVPHAPPRIGRKSQPAFGGLMQNGPP